MDKLEEVKERLDKLVETHEESIQKAVAENNGQIDEKINKMQEDLATLKQSTEDYFNQLKQRMTSLGMEQKDIDEFSFAKALYGITTGDWEKCGYEKSIFDDTRKKAIDTNSGAGGGFLIPVELAVDKLIEPAIAKAVMKDLGCEFITGLTADVDLPEATSRPSLTFGADGAAVTAEDITWADKQLRPKYGKMLCKVSNNLLIQQQAAEGWVRKLMQDGLKIGMDKYSIQGTGAASYPLGILYTPGTNTTDISSSRMTIDDVAGMIEDIEEQDFEPTGLLTRSKVKNGLLRERVPMYSGQTNGMPQFDPWMSLAKIEEMTGIKLRWTSNVPVSSNLTSAVVGKWDEFIIAMWGNIRIKVSQEAGTALAQDQTWIAMFANMDCVCRRPLAFDIASNVSTNF